MNKWAVDLLVSWLPFLALIGVWVWLSRRGIQPRSKSGNTIIELYERQVEESRRINANLERIAAALEKREKS